MKLWMIIGIPGSGKSTKAKEIAEIYNIKIFEADMFFIDKNGKYCWKGDLLPKAHGWCYDKIEDELKAGHSVIVANTFLKRKDRKRYIDLAKQFNAEIEVITCTGNFQNIHGVTPEKIQIMKDKFQPFSSDEL